MLLTPMAQSGLEISPFSFVVAVLLFVSCPAFSQPPLDPAEQEAVYAVLASLDSTIPWRTLFPDDLCSSAPHGVVCDYFADPSSADAEVVPHVIELNFGYVSDYTPNPPCGRNPNLDPLLLKPLTHLRKLFFYKCFTGTEFTFPDFSPLSSQNQSSLEELVFIENPGLVGTLDGKFGKLGNLRRLVVTGSGVLGGFSFDDLVSLEQLTLSGNKLKGEILSTVFRNLKRLRILDLSCNEFQGTVPESIGNMTELLKIDLSYNGFSGRIPEVFKGLRSLEFLDLSYNNFGNYGVPLFLSEMPSLREVYLSGNLLGGEIPEIWGSLGGMKGIGLSGVGLVGNIPKSMGIHLRNVWYMGLDNNKLEGMVPEEFGGLEHVSELNLGNNCLSGRLPFSAGFVSRLGGKLKVEGNLDICIDEGLLRSAKVSGLLQLRVCRQQPDVPKTALFHVSSCSRLDTWLLVVWLLMGFGFSGLFWLV